MFFKIFSPLFIIININLFNFHGSSPTLIKEKIPIKAQILKRFNILNNLNTTDSYMLADDHNIYLYDGCQNLCIIKVLCNKIKNIPIYNYSNQHLDSYGGGLTLHDNNLWITKTIDGHGEIIGIKKKNHKIFLKKFLNHGIIGEAKIISNGNIIIKDVLGSIFCFHKNGSLVWQHKSEMSESIYFSSHCHLYVHKKYLLCPYINGSLKILDVQSGYLQNTIYLEGTSINNEYILSILGHEDKCYLLTNNGLYLLDTFTWSISKKISINATSPGIIIQNQIFFHDNKYFYVVNAKKMAIIKKIKIYEKNKENKWTNVVSLHNKIILCSSLGKVFYFNMESENYGISMKNNLMGTNCTPIVFQKNQIFLYNKVGCGVLFKILT